MRFLVRHLENLSLKEADALSANRPGKSATGFDLYFEVGGLIPGAGDEPALLLAPPPDGAAVVVSVFVVPAEFVVMVVLLLLLSPQPVQNAAIASKARTPKTLRIISVSCR